MPNLHIRQRAVKILTEYACDTCMIFKIPKKKKKIWEEERWSVRSQNHHGIPPSAPKVFVLLCSTAYMDLLFDSHHITDICILKIFQDALVSGLYFPIMSLICRVGMSDFTDVLPFKHYVDECLGSYNQQSDQNPTPVVISKVPHIY